MTAKVLPFCPFCHQAWSNIKENGTAVVLTCKNCNQIMTIQSDISAVEPTRVSLTYTPDLIISSYEQLITLLKNDEVYGALIKIKDIFELIVRFPLVIILSQVGNKLVRKENDTDFTAEYKSLHKTLQKFMHDVLYYKLSLGNWVTIAGEIKKVFYNKIFTEEADNTCLQTLYNINKINHKAYTDNFITSWRNNTIGHGALNCNKEEVRKDLLDKLNILNDILLENEELYKDIIVSIEENTVSIKSNTSDHSLTVSPFISIEPPDPTPLSAEADVLSMFDSYDQKKHKALNINYTNGEKKHSAELSSALSELADKLKNYDSLSILNKYGSGNITDETIYSLSVEILNKLTERTLSHGSCFSEWFIQCLNRSGGIFLCCAERGMGKSTFAHAVDQLNIVEIKNNQRLKDYLRKNNNSLLIRTYHFNSYYNSDLVTFLARMKDIFTSVLIKNEHEVAYTKSITYISHSIERAYNDLYNAAINESVPIQKKQQLFFKFLKVVQAVWRNSEYQKEKLILFLDGIDEIKNGKNNIDITEWIPSDSKLQEQCLENIYIILTSRHPEEIAGGQNLGSFLAADRFADTLMLKRVPEKLMYSTYHWDYLEDVKSMLRITEDKRARELADFLEWRYSYLTVYKKIYDFNDNENIAEFMKDPFEAYLKQLGILSKDYSQKIQSLFNLLTTTEEALTLEEISYLLTGDNNPTFQTLDMLMDIGNFLTTERDAVRGNVFKITHPDWVEKIANNKRLQENKKQLLKNLRSMLLDISKQDYDELDFSQKDFDGETWLIANIELFDVDYDNLHSLLVLMDNSHFEKIYQIKRKIKFFTYAISFLKKLADEHCNSERFFYLDDLAGLLTSRAMVLSDIKNPQKALEDLDQAIAILQQLAEKSRRDGTYFDFNLLAGSLYNKAIILKNLNVDQSLNDCEEAIRILETLKEKNLRMIKIY